MIREFRNEDLDNVMEIWLNTNIETHEFIQKEYWLHNFNMVKEILPTSEVYIYEQGVIKGFVGISDGYIAGIFVLGTEQSKGIGKQLLEMVKSKYDKLTLAVYEKNTKAIHFYERQGFKPTSKSIDENTGEVEIYMIWEKE